MSKNPSWTEVVQFDEINIETFIKSLSSGLKLNYIERIEYRF